MSEILKESMSVVNNLHDLILYLVKRLGLSLTDKQLHFIVIAAIGVVIFAIVQISFKYISRYSITAISFIYTFTLLVVIVFGIEIGQKVSNRGNMEFADIVYGLWGFIYVFCIYAFIKGGVLLFKRKRQLKRVSESKAKSPR